jgi:hypothetical protein
VGSVANSRQILRPVRLQILATEADILPATENGLHSHFWKHEIPLRPFFGTFFVFLINLFFTLFNTISSAASDSTLSEDAGPGSRTFLTLAMAVRHSNRLAMSHPHSARSHPHLARSHPTRLDLIPTRLDLIHQLG